jgi:hypothetical protein
MEVDNAMKCIIVFVQRPSEYEFIALYVPADNSNSVGDDRVRVQQWN